MPPPGLLFWTKNDASRVALLNRKYSLWGCFFEPKIPLPGLLFEPKMPPLGLLFWTGNSTFGVTFVNWKYRLYGCFFEPKMPPLGQVPPGAFCPLRTSLTTPLVFISFINDGVFLNVCLLTLTSSSTQTCSGVFCIARDVITVSRTSETKHLDDVRKSLSAATCNCKWIVCFQLNIHAAYQFRNKLQRHSHQEGMQAACIHVENCTNEIYNERHDGVYYPIKAACCWQECMQ